MRFRHIALLFLIALTGLIEATPSFALTWPPPELSRRPLGEDEIKTLRKLDGVEIRALFLNASVRTLATEGFNDDGSYHIHIDRVTEPGRFFIRGASLCTELLGNSVRDKCRDVYVANDGKYYFTKANDASVAWHFLIRKRGANDN